MANGTGIMVLRTPVRAPNANAVCEHFLRSVRAARLAQKIPNGPREPPVVGATVEAAPILGDLHHDYRLAA